MSQESHFVRASSGNPGARAQPHYGQATSRFTVAFSALLVVLCTFAPQAKAAVSVTDDAGAEIVLSAPAKRVVSLAPHVTEFLFAAGGADKIVGAVDYSDYPPAARSIPRVGSNRMVDLEKLLSLKPDLLVVWRHNASLGQMEQLRKLGIPLFYSEPHALSDIPDTLVKLGKLMGTDAHAGQVASELRQQITSLNARYRNRPRVRVFYQVWDRPLYTLNERHIVSDAIRTCGGENIFARLPASAPQVNPEAVLQEDPDAVVAGGRGEQPGTGTAIWKNYPSMRAVKHNNLFVIDGDLMNRSGPRIIAGATALCEKLELVRQRRGDKP